MEASAKDITNMAMIAAGITAMNFPMTPETKNSGTNAMMVVATLENTLGRTSVAPSIEACKFDLPIRR